MFVTNNSTKSRADYKKKLDGLGIPAKVVGEGPFFWFWKVDLLVISPSNSVELDSFFCCPFVVRFGEVLVSLANVC